VPAARRTAQPGGADLLRRLVGRFDVDAFHAKERVRLRLEIEGQEASAFEAIIENGSATLVEAASTSADAVLRADRATWQRLAVDLRSGLLAHETGRLQLRRNVDLALAFLAATGGDRSEGRLRVERIETAGGVISTMSAGTGDPVLLIHGLGGTKLSFLPMMLRLATSHRAISVDIPGFGDSYKPYGARYHAPFFAHAVIELLDALDIPKAHIVGNSMGGRIALDLGLRHPERVRRLGLLAPSLAWRCDRTWAPLLRWFLPQLAALQVTPRWLAETLVDRLVPRSAPGWFKSGLDEFMRVFQTPRGRVAFYAAARQIYLEEPYGDRGFWTRLATLQSPALFVWGRRDNLVPFGFMRHVQSALATARHLELDCGHVPHLERPRQTWEALAAFLGGERPATRRGGARAARVRRPAPLTRIRTPALG